MAARVLVIFSRRKSLIFGWDADSIPLFMRPFWRFRWARSPGEVGHPMPSHGLVGLVRGWFGSDCTVFEVPLVIETYEWIQWRTCDDQKESYLWTGKVLQKTENELQSLKMSIWHVAMETTQEPTHALFNLWKNPTAKSHDFQFR